VELDDRSPVLAKIVAQYVLFRDESRNFV